MHKIKKSKTISIIIALSIIIGLINPGIIIQAKEREMDNKSDITIFHTNDTHGRVKGDKNIIGIDKISAIKNSVEGSLLIDAGDTLHGLPFATMNKGADIVELMKIAGYDLMAPGNHDFNYGYERLLELSRIANSGENKFEIISSNVLKNNKPILNPNSIKTINGVKVGFFGLTSEETAYKTNPNNVKGIEFKNTIEAAKEQVKELEKLGADIIIALAHVGTDDSTEITTEKIAENVEGIDVIVDGHSHSKFENGFEADNDTLIVSTGEYEENLGKVTISFDKNSKEITKKEASLINSSEVSDIVPNAKVTEKIKEIDNAQNEILSQVIGKTDVKLDGERENVRTRETNLGNLLTDAMISNTGAEIAITNGGGIRSSINVGNITKGDVIAVLPFGNFLVTKKLTGEQIKDVLEHGVKSYPATAGQFTHVSGMKFKFDPNKEEGNRVYSITINDRPIDMNKKYVVATNDFISAGGDGYPHFGSIPTENEFSALDEVLADHIKKLGTINTGVEGRITTGNSEDEKPEVPEQPDNPDEKPEVPAIKPEKLNEVPVINAKDITIKINESFNPLDGVTATDKEDGSLTSKIKVKENTVNNKKIGEYKVVYSVTDSKGATSTKEIKVTVTADKDIPSTGREDTVLFLIIGIMTISLGGILLIKRNKKVN